MRIFWIPFVTAIVVNLLLDWLIYRQLKRCERLPKLKSRAHLVLTALLTLLLLVVFLLPVRSVDNGKMHTVMWCFYIYFAFYIPKYVALLVWLPSLACKKRARRVITHCATAVGLFLFGAMWWGALVTPYRTEVKEVTLEYDNLPAAFDGYRIVQFSDAHVGTYNGDTAFVAKYVAQINDLKPDMIVFTGDLVNRQTSEADPFTEVLARLKAPDGVFSILGNHDYDDYMKWPDEEQKLADQQRLIDLQEEAGWVMLNNDHRLIGRDSDTIAIIGTENYGDPPFPQLGNLSEAYPDVNDGRFKILLQHNPYAWRDDVLKHSNIDLMLAGHTHAMQMMVTFFGHNYSPSSWRYDEWAGLYREDEKALYVNIGVGMVGFPARLGSATPELTVITLKRKAAK